MTFSFDSNDGRCMPSWACPRGLVQALRILIYRSLTQNPVWISLLSGIMIGLYMGISILVPTP